MQKFFNRLFRRNVLTIGPNYTDTGVALCEVNQAFVDELNNQLHAKYGNRLTVKLEQ